jgi:uncharacterized protein (TIGR01440 family)
MSSFLELQSQAEALLKEFIEAAELKKNDLLVIGCSTSEVLGKNIGKGGSLEAAKAITDGFLSILKEKEINFAAQCCEHLNRALVVEKKYCHEQRLKTVMAVPYPTAGGAFASAVYRSCISPVLVEEIEADAGIDIGDTLIGMHLKAVAVPLRLSRKKLGEANLVFARTRPKLIGGERAKYALE